ncbi:MAG: histidine kinase [Xanthomarina sp.]
MIWHFFYISLFIISVRVVKRNCLFYSFFFITAISFSQQHTNYTTNDGLPSNHVYKIAQDSKGFMWFGTDKGVVKYNGNTMKTFTTKDGLATNDVWGIHPTPDGKLWFLSKAYKLGYIENDRVYAFESEQKEEIFNPIFTSQVNNDVFLASASKSHVLNNDKWQVLMNYNVEDSISHNYIKHPVISSFEYQNTSDSIVIKDNENRIIKTVGFMDVVKNIHSRGQITDSLFYWVDNKQYVILNLNTLKFHKKSFKDEIGLDQTKNARINLINKQLQISGNGFVGVLDKDFNIKNTFYIPEYFGAHFGFIDKSGSIWLASFTNGIYYLPIEKQNITYCLPAERIANMSVVHNKIIANVFNQGFYKYDASKNTFLPYIDESEHVYGATYINQLNTEYYLSKSNIKVIKNNQIERFDFSKNRFAVNDKARQLVFYNNFLYGSYSNGVNKINPDNFKVETSYLQSAINHLFIFNNLFLVATSNGLKKFQDEKFHSVVFENQEFNKSVLSLTKLSKSEILINTDGFGSYISDLKTIHLLPESDFLIVNKAFVKDGVIWLATESGILKYTKKNNAYVKQILINKSHGLPSNNVSDVIVIEDKLIASTNNGIAILPINQKRKTQLLDVYFEKSNYNNQHISDSNLVFNYQKNNLINFEVSSIDFSENNKDLAFYYKLEPIHKEWIKTTTNNFNFNNLQPEKYTLFIDSHGIKKQLSFSIKPLWWQKIWFKTVVVLLSFSLVALISRHFVQQSQFKKNQKIFEDNRLSELQLKALRSQMNPHFVFNSLSAIQYYMGENNFETSELYLVKFSKLIRQFFELSKENEIRLATEVSLLENYLDIEKLRFKEKLNFVIHVDANLDVKNTKIPTMLLQPIVENAVNHGIFNKIENGLVNLNFIYIDNQTFKVEIIDDGVGFVNTSKRPNKTVKSSNVLKDRLHFLNVSKKWEISYKSEEVNPESVDKGNKSVFLIKNNK